MLVCRTELNYLNYLNLEQFELNIQFPQELQQKGKEEVQPVHIEGHFTGIGDADPEGIEGQSRQQQIVHCQLERPDDFHVERPAQDSAVGIHKQCDDHIQRQYHEQVPDPDLTGVIGQGEISELHPVGQQEANEQGNQVNHHEIQMLQPRILAFNLHRLPHL